MSLQDVPLILSFPLKIDNMMSSSGIPIKQFLYPKLWMQSLGNKYQCWWRHFSRLREVVSPRVFVLPVFAKLHAWRILTASCWRDNLRVLGPLCFGNSSSFSTKTFRIRFMFPWLSYLYQQEYFLCFCYLKKDNLCYSCYLSEWLPTRNIKELCFSGRLLMMTTFVLRLISTPLSTSPVIFSIQFPPWFWKKYT